MTRLTIYTSTVTSWRTAVGAALAAGALSAAILLIVGSTGAQFAVAFGPVVLLGLLVSVHLATVRLTVSADGVGIGSGIRGRTRWIPANEITAAGTTQLSWPAVFGAGLPVAWRSTRLTVRAGRALALRLASGERVWVSTPDPDAATALLGAIDSDNDKEDVAVRSARRPWFGPKRVGWGYRPQTWQGWTLTLGFVVTITLVALLAHQR